MWIVIKYKKKNLNLLKNNLQNKFDLKIKFYIPKIIFKKKIKKLEKSFEQNILYNYIFCFSEKFKDCKNLIKIQYLQGLDYYLNGYINDQIQIQNFINLCRKNETTEGSLSKNFFLELKIKKAKFANGPFVNLIFDIIEENKNQIKILLDNKSLLINKNSNISYCLV